MKCHCQTCNGHIEFDAVNAGSLVECPHCGIETTLFKPVEAITVKPKRKINKRLVFGALSALLLVAAFTAFAIALYSVPAFGDFAATGAGAVIAILVLGLIAFWSVMWLLFPIVVYFQLSGIEKAIRDGNRGNHG